MKLLIKTDCAQGGAGQVVPGPVVAAESHVVHEALATPMEGVVNVDHSMVTPAVRTRMVERVRALIAAGFYDRPEFLEMLAEKIQREF